MTILFSAGQRTDTSCMQHSQTAGARTLNFIFLIMAFNLTVQPTDYEI